MRGATAKILRRQAKAAAIEWYRSLIDDTEGATDEELYSYVVDCEHVMFNEVMIVSLNTKRRFYLEEKKQWKRLHYLHP